MAHSIVVIGHALNLKNNCISLVFQTHVFMSHKPTCILSISGQFEHNMDSIILRSLSICCVYCSRRFKFYRYFVTPFYDNSFIQEDNFINLFMNFFFHFRQPIQLIRHCYCLTVGQPRFPFVPQRAWRKGRYPRMSH